MMKLLKQTCIVLTAIILFGYSTSEVSETPPNIIFILADDLGYGDVSCYNENSKINTPHIDK